MTSQPWGYDDAENMRLAIVAELAEWIRDNPEAAARWSGMKRDDLPEFIRRASRRK